MPYRELLDRATVLANLESARTYLEDVQTLDMGDAPPLMGEETLEVIAAINHSLQNVDRIDPEPEPVYFSRDPIIGGFQTGVEEYARRLEPDVSEDFDRPFSLEDYVALDEAPPLPVVTDERLPIEPGSDMETFSFPGCGAVARFGKTLIRGGAIGVATVYRAFKGGPSDFNPIPARGTLEPNARLYITSDWASGERRAEWLSSRITRRIRDDNELGRSHVVHLGDVYHAGRPRECRSNALKPWPVQGNSAARSWDLNGNHDMYSGGCGYFGTLLSDLRFRRQRSNGRPTSIFELENEHWVVLGLDTAWTPDRFALATAGGLDQRQRGWIERSIRKAEASQKKVILLSHHQLFSAFDHPVILEQELGGFLRNHPVHAWFWGHEHVCTLYLQRQEVAHARCVGNGGVSSLVKPLAEAWQPGIVKRHFEGAYREPLDGRPAQLFGFAVLELSGPDLRVTYVDENDHEWHWEDI